MLSLAIGRPSDYKDMPFVQQENLFVHKTDCFHILVFWLINYRQIISKSLKIFLDNTAIFVLLLWEIFR